MPFAPTNTVIQQIYSALLVTSYCALHRNNSLCAGAGSVSAERVGQGEMCGITHRVTCTWWLLWQASCFGCTNVVRKHYSNLVEASFLQWRWLMSGCDKGHDCVYCSCKCRSTWVQFWSWGFDRKENMVNCRHAYAKYNLKWNSLGFERFKELSIAFSGESTVNCFCCSLVQNKHKILYEKVGVLSWAYTIHTLNP